MRVGLRRNSRISCFQLEVCKLRAEFRRRPGGLATQKAVIKVVRTDSVSAGAVATEL